MSRISIGLDIQQLPPLPGALDEAISSGFDFLSLSLFHTQAVKAAAGAEAGAVHATVSDLVLPGERWSTCVVGKLSSWLALDAAEEALRKRSEKALREELAWASHLGVPAVMVTSLMRLLCAEDSAAAPPHPSAATVDAAGGVAIPSCANLAMQLNRTLQGISSLHYWVQLPLGAAGWQEERQRQQALQLLLASSPLTQLGAAGEGEKGAKLLKKKVAGMAAGAADMFLEDSEGDSDSDSSGDDALQEEEEGGGGSAAAYSSGPPPKGSMRKMVAGSTATADIAMKGPAKAKASLSAASFSASAAPSSSACDPWQLWNKLRCFTGFSPRLSIALLITKTLPAEAELRRWLGEPLRAAIIPTSIFSFNKSGRPVLSKQHESFLKELHRRKVQFLLQGSGLELQPFLSSASSSFTSSLAPSGAQESGFDAAEDEGKQEGSARAKCLDLSSLQPYLQYITHMLQSTTSPSPASSSSSSSSSPLTLLSPSEVEAFEAPYYDVLQAPLQPLMDNLESGTYEVFERDPVKYDLYQQAVKEALLQLKGKREGAAAAAEGALAAGMASPAAPLATSPAAAASLFPSPITVMVVGAGRGPLVTRVLRAADSVGVPVRVYAVEKNANAVITLKSLLRAGVWDEKQALQQLKGGGAAAVAAGGAAGGSSGRAKGAPRVTIIASDMRDLCPAEDQKADILVSELLGSFGDNELSPECLDGAEKLLKQPLGISIPCQSRSYLHPVMSSKLWNEVKGLALREEKMWETPFVVKLHSFCPLAEPQLCFTFDHPSWREAGQLRPAAELEGGGDVARTGAAGGAGATVEGLLAALEERGLFCPPSSESSSSSSLSSPSSSPPPPDNTRFCTLSFTCSMAGIVHGLAGYFDSQLFGATFLSILPSTHSAGMFSWFPILFPLKEPVQVAAGDILQVHLWRCVSSRKVWYEWAVSTEHCTSSLHNPAGRSYWIGL